MNATTMLDEAWGAVGGDADVTARLTMTGGSAAPLTGHLAVGELATATAGTAVLAAAELEEARGGSFPAAALDAAHVAAAFASERHVRVDGAVPGPVFDPLSTFLSTADGWIRLHANYPHHRAALMRALKHPRGGAADVPAAVAGWEAEALEEAIIAAGGCAAAVRDREAWRTGPVGADLAVDGLLDFEPGVPRTVDGFGDRPHVPGAPLSGLRILDLTRVVAGPVGTRMLAALGAQVLRVDGPQMPELALLWADSGAGRRSTHLHLPSRPDRERLHRLLDDTDVLIAGYRPGALDPFGLSAEVLVEKHPHLCTVTLSAWGQLGPWAGRRGFDSLVQAATGIAHELSEDGGATPGALPVQALDHGTGYLIAAAAMRALTLRALDQRASHARVALARTAMWLLHQAPVEGGGYAGEPVAAERYCVDLASPLGDVRAARPPGTLDGRPLGWTAGPPLPGSAPPYWV